MLHLTESHRLLMLDVLRGNGINAKELEFTSYTGALSLRHLGGYDCDIARIKNKPYRLEFYKIRNMAFIKTIPNISGGIEVESRIKIVGENKEKEIESLLLKWVRCVSKELNAGLQIDAILNSEYDYTNMNFGDEYFTREQILILEQRISTYEDYIKDVLIPEDQLAEILEIVQGIKKEIEKTTKKQFVSMIVSGIVSAIISLGINPTTANLLMRGLITYVLQFLALPK